VTICHVFLPRSQRKIRKIGKKSQCDGRQFSITMYKMEWKLCVFEAKTVLFAYVL
jgi:hypothetical protein